MGLVTSATNAPIVKALSISAIVQEVQKWDFVAGITSNLSIDSKPVGEDIETVLSSWGNLSDY